MPTPDLTPYRVIPPTPLDDFAAYRAFQGGSLLERLDAAGGVDPEAAIAALEASGLRGRGGGGFPTGTKWRSLYENPAPRKFVVLNAAEGEPGSFKDRWLLRHNPYAVLEAMTVAAWILDCDLAYIGIKKAYKRERERLEAAVLEMADLDLFGALEFEIVEGPDEYLFGEEKALLNTIDGQGPFPREPHYPPYEWGIEPTAASPNPALVQNVESMARATTVLLHGAAGFAALGCAGTRGPLLVTLSGAVANPGIYEVEAGRSLRDILDAEGGGPSGPAPWVGALPGVSFPILVADRFDTPLDYTALDEAGSGLGAAGFVLLDATASIPRVATQVARFLAVESCAQCHACKLGLTTAYQELAAIDPRLGADRDHLRRAEEWARSAPNGNRCNLPVQGASIVPSLLEDFPEVFAAGEDGGEPAEFYLPKFIDYDPLRRRFRVDRRHLRKRMDWSYAPLDAASPATGGPGGKGKDDSGGEETAADGEHEIEV